MRRCAPRGSNLLTLALRPSHADCLMHHVAQVQRLCQWVEQQVAKLEQAKEQAQAQAPLPLPPPPPPPPPPLVPWCRP